MLEFKNGKKTYKLEYSIEASLYNACTESFMELISRFAESMDGQDSKEMIKSISNVPQSTLTMFYAGLMENHSDEIHSEDDAKNLLKAMMKSDDERFNDFYSVMNVIIESMRDDGFFKLIGLEQMMVATQNA